MRPDAMMPYVNASIVSLQLGDSDKAFRYLKAAYRLEPNNAAVNMNLGLLFAERGDLVKAEDYLRVALENESTMPQAAYNLAVIVGEENPEQAVALCRRALQVEPGNGKYQQALMYYMGKNGQHHDP